MSKLGASVILVFSRKPYQDDFPAGVEGKKNNPLNLLRRVYPDLDSWIAGKAVLDFGCGTGKQSLQLSRSGARIVVGVDTNEKVLIHAIDMVSHTRESEKIRFVSRLEEHHEGMFDVVISQNAMEHFPDPDSVMKQMIKALKPGGRLLITFGPPWLAPYGSHMHFFTRVPWLNIVFSEDSVMRARALFRSDSAMRYVDVESGLNKMSVGRFERMLEAHGLRPDYSRYDCVKGLNFLARIPLLRELFINHVTVSLRK